MSNVIAIISIVLGAAVVMLLYLRWGVIPVVVAFELGRKFEQARCRRRASS